MMNENMLLELIGKVKRGEEDSMGQLLELYKPLIDAKVAEHSQVLEEDDIRQICAIGLFDAAQSYDAKKARDKVTFGLYAKICVRNRLISELRKVRPASDPMEERHLGTDGTLEADFIRREEISSLIESVYSRLTEYEKLVLQLYLAGKSYAEVSRILDRPLKSVDNAMSRVRAKFRELL